ncbi:MAG TPA: glycosyltransferase [Bryobacteraceae bacterium]|nr:glycosyltransferase [Bryobacteraceae bacterium]
MPTLDFLYFDAGGGHRAAATALKHVIEQQQRPWDVRLVNVQELLDALDVFRKLTGLRLQDIYNNMLKHGWTLGSTQLMRGMQAIIRMYHGPQVRLFESHWRESRPDVVVSFIPHFNRAIAESLRNASPQTRFVTVITDLADYPPHFWIERESPYVVCGTEKAVEQAHSAGLGDERLFRASGMIIQPRFYDPIHLDRAAHRQRLGLDPERPTGLVLFGGFGASVMRDIVKQLDGSGLDVQLILICGRNEKLRKGIQNMKTRIPVFTEGFTREVPYYMHLSDFFIGKPGPGSISEALAMKLPVLLERNAWTLPQERYNADWVLERGVGLVVKSFRKEAAAAVGTLLEPGNFTRFRERAAAVENRAVFEIADCLGMLLNQSAPLSE